MKFRIISGLAVISSFALFGIAKSGEVLVDPALKDVQQFLKGDIVTVDNSALGHLPTTGPNYIAQTTTFVGKPILVQHEVKVLGSPPPAQPTQRADYGPLDKSDVFLSHTTHKGHDKTSVTILKEFSFGAVPKENKEPHPNIQYAVHNSPSPDIHLQEIPQNSYGAEGIGESGNAQAYKNSPPIQEFIDQHSQYSVGTSFAIGDQGQNIQENNQYNQLSITEGNNNGYGQPEQQSENIGYQNNQQQSGGYDQGSSQQLLNGGYDQQLTGGYQQQQIQTGGYQQDQQQTGGYQQQQQPTGGYQQQQQQQIGGYQEQQQQQIGGYQEQQQQQIAGYQQPQQQQQIGGYQEQQQQQIGGYQEQQQQQIGGYQEQQQQQIGGYQQQLQQQPQIGGYNNQQASIQQPAGGYNNQGPIQQQSVGGYDQNIQQQQSNGDYAQNSVQQQNSALFQRQENGNGIVQGSLQQAQLQSHGQLLQQNSQQLVQSLGFGPILEQAELVFKSEVTEPTRPEGQGNGGYQQQAQNQQSQTSNNNNQYGPPNQSQNSNAQYGVPDQSQNSNNQYGVPGQSQNSNNQYGVPGQSQNSNNQYGVPGQSQNSNNQYGVPSQSQNSNNQYGVPGQSQNAKSPMEGWTPIKPQFSRTHYAKGGDQTAWTPKVAKSTNLVQGGYSDNVNLATKDFRVNNLVVDKSSVIQSYNSDKAAKVVIHAQNVIIKSDIPVEKTNIIGSNGHTRDITPILKEQLRALMNNRAQQQQKDSSITAKTNAFVAIPNYFKPSNIKPLPLINLRNNGVTGTGGYANQVNQISSGYNLATSVQQASAYSNNVNKFQSNNQVKAPLASKIPNDYGVGLQAPQPYAVASNNVNVAAGTPSPLSNYNTGSPAPPIGSAATASQNNYAPPPVPTAFTLPASKIRFPTKSPPNDYHAGLYAPPPKIVGSVAGGHIPEGKIAGEPVPVQSQRNIAPPRGKGPPRFKSGKPGSTRDYGSSVSYFGKSRPTSQKLKDTESQYSEDTEYVESFGSGNEHPFAYLATKPPPEFQNFTIREKYRYRTKRPKLFSLSYGDETKRPEKIVQGAPIDLQGIITSSSHTKDNYKYRETSSKEKPTQGSGYSIEFTDPYTRLGKDLFYSVYDMIKKNTPSFQSIASIPRVITSTMKGIKIPPVRLEFYRN